MQRQVKTLQLALQTMSAALFAPAHAHDGNLGTTASQVELSSCTSCSAEQGLVLDTDFLRLLYHKSHAV